MSGLNIKYQRIIFWLTIIFCITLIILPITSNNLFYVEQKTYKAPYDKLIGKWIAECEGDCHYRRYIEINENNITEYLLNKEEGIVFVKTKEMVIKWGMLHTKQEDGINWEISPVKFINNNSIIISGGVYNKIDQQ